MARQLGDASGPGDELLDVVMIGGPESAASIEGMADHGRPRKARTIRVAIGLVQASPQCTGS